MEEGLWGHYNITVDDKGRMILPSKIRAEIPGNTLVITRGNEKCLWLFLPDEWVELKETLLSGASFFDLNSQDLLRRLVSPASEVVIDNAGRIKISAPMIRMIGLVKQGYLMGVGNRLEIWDALEYESFEEEKASGVRQRWQDMGKRVDDA